MTKKNVLITGMPGVGKTTLIKRLSDELKQYRPVGFYTAEIRERGVRRGFELVTLDGRRGILSHVDIESPFKVGKYAVDVGRFEEFLDSIAFLDPKTRLVVIDEIGKMECFSDTFKRLLNEVLDSDKTVVATIARKGGGTISEIKRRQDVELFEISRNSRDLVQSQILSLIRNKS